MPLTVSKPFQSLTLPMVYEGGEISLNVSDGSIVSIVSTSAFVVIGAGEGIGSSEGTSTVSAIGASLVAATGATAGLSVVAGLGASLVDATGSVTASATASGEGAFLASATGTSSGASTVSGEGASGVIGSSTGTSTVSGFGASIAAATGISDGVSTTSGAGSSVAAATGTSAGTSTVSGVNSPDESFVITGMSITDDFTGKEFASSIFDTFATTDGISLTRVQGSGPVPAALDRYNDRTTNFGVDLQAGLDAGGVTWLIGIEGMDQNTGLTSYVDDFGNPPAIAYEGALLWHEAAQTAGVTEGHAYFRWWADNTPFGGFNQAWRDNITDVLWDEWNSIETYVNANKSGALPFVWIYGDALMAVLWDRVDNGTITSFAFDDLFRDTVHQSNPLGQWATGVLAWCSLRGTDPDDYPLALDDNVAITQGQKDALVTAIRDVIADPTIALAVTNEAVGTSAGISTVSAIGASTASAAGTSDGVSAVSGTGSSVFEAVGSSDGVSTVSGVGSSSAIATGTGTSEGISTASAIGASTAESTGNSDGISTVSATGSSAGGGVDNPTVIMGVNSIAWLDTQDATTMFNTITGTGAITTDGDLVGRIVDQEASANFNATGNTAARPIYRTASGGYLEGVEADNTLLNASVSNSGAGYLAFRVRVRSQTASTAEKVNVLHTVAGGSWFIGENQALVTTNFGQLTLVEEGGGPGVGNLATNTWYTVEYIWDTDDRTITLNGTTSTDTGTYATPTTTLVTLLGEPGGGGGNIDLGRWAFAGSIPTAGQRTDMRAWLEE